LLRKSYWGFWCINYWTKPIIIASWTVLLRPCIHDLELTSSQSSLFKSHISSEWPLNFSSSLTLSIHLGFKDSIFIFNFFLYFVSLLFYHPRVKSSLFLSLVISILFFHLLHQKHSENTVASNNHAHAFGFQLQLLHIAKD